MVFEGKSLMVSVTHQEDFRRTAIPYWLVLSGFAPLLFWHAGQLLGKPHYQFLLLLPPVLWILVCSLEQEDLSADRQLWEPVTGAAILVICLTGLSVATWFWSPWIAAVCFQVAWSSVLLAQEGWSRLRSWLPVWIFCWVIVPLPFGMDEDLIIYLRGTTTRIASSVLDQTGILHNCYANVIELPGKSLFIADACSGIHSLYVLMASALFLALWLRRTVIHCVMLLISTFAVVIAENVARIVSVAAAHGWQTDLSTGWKHELLGIILFCASLCLVFSTDQLLMFALPTRLPSILKYLRQSAEHHRRKPEAGQAEVTSAYRRASQTVLVIAVLFPVAGVAQLVRMPENLPSFASLHGGEPDIPEFGREALPQTLDGFEFTDYSVIERVPGDPLGQLSRQWRYQKGPLSVMVSLDYPYGGIHDLIVCYTQIGWRVEESRIVPADESEAVSGSDIGEFAVAVLDRDLYGKAVLIFQLSDMSGTTVAVLKDGVRGGVGNRITGRFQNAGVDNGVPDAGHRPVPPYFQIQAFVRSSDVISDRDRMDVFRFYIAVQQVLKAKVLNPATGAEAVP